MKLLAVIPALLSVTAFGIANADPVSYKIEPNHTFVNFEVLRHFNTSTTRGRFDKKDGNVVIDTKAKTGKVDITIDVNSISTGVADLDKHLRSKDFFNVSEHPTAKFSSDQFKFNEGKVTSVNGLLLLNGISNPVTLTASNFNCYASPILKKEVCGGDFEASISRSQWGMSYGVPSIPDNIRLLITVEAFKE